MDTNQNQSFTNNQNLKDFQEDLDNTVKDFEKKLEEVKAHGKMLDEFFAQSDENMKKAYAELDRVIDEMGEEYEKLVIEHTEEVVGD